MRLYHRTSKHVAQLILRDGFIDGVGNYLTDHEYRGVWLSNVPLDSNEGAHGDALLAVDLDLGDNALAEFEWVEQGKPYREFLIPAETVNAHSCVTIASEE